MKNLIKMVLFGLILVNFLPSELMAQKKNVKGNIPVVDKADHKNPIPGHIKAHTGKNIPSAEIIESRNTGRGSFVPVSNHEQVTIEKIRFIAADLAMQDGIDLKTDEERDKWVEENSPLGVSKTWHRTLYNTNDSVQVGDKKLPKPAKFFVERSHPGMETQSIFFEKNKSFKPLFFIRDLYIASENGYTEDEETLDLRLWEIFPNNPRAVGVEVPWISRGCGNDILPANPIQYAGLPPREPAPVALQQNVQPVFGARWGVTASVGVGIQAMPWQNFNYCGRQFFNYCWNNCGGCQFGGCYQPVVQTYSYQGQPVTYVYEGDTYTNNYEYNYTYEYNNSFNDIDIDDSFNEDSFNEDVVDNDDPDEEDGGPAPGNSDGNNPDGEGPSGGNDGGNSDGGDTAGNETGGPAGGNSDGDNPDGEGPAGGNGGGKSTLMSMSQLNDMLTAGGLETIDEVFIGDGQTITTNLHSETISTSNKGDGYAENQQETLESSNSNQTQFGKDEAESVYQGWEVFNNNNFVNEDIPQKPLTVASKKPETGSMYADNSEIFDTVKPLAEAVETYQNQETSVYGGGEINQTLQNEDWFAAFSRNRENDYVGTGNTEKPNLHQGGTYVKPRTPQDQFYGNNDVLNNNTKPIGSNYLGNNQEFSQNNRLNTSNSNYYESSSFNNIQTDVSRNQPNRLNVDYSGSYIDKTPPTFTSSRGKGDYQFQSVDVSTPSRINSSGRYNISATNVSPIIPTPSRTTTTIPQATMSGGFVGSKGGGGSVSSGTSRSRR